LFILILLRLPVTIKFGHCFGPIGMGGIILGTIFLIIPHIFSSPGYNAFNVYVISAPRGKLSSVNKSPLN
jgi:hypothetical protein